MFAFGRHIDRVAPGPTRRPIGGAYAVLAFVLTAPDHHRVAVRVDCDMRVATFFPRLRHQRRGFPFTLFGPVGAFDHIVRAVVVHPDRGRVAAGVHRRLRSEAFAFGERNRFLPRAGEGSERAHDHFALLPDSRVVAFPVDGEPGFRVGPLAHFGEVDGFRPRPTRCPADRLDDGHGPGVAFPEHGQIAVAVDDDLRRLRIVSAGKEFPFQFRLREVFGRAPGLPRRPEGAFDDGVAPVPSIPHGGGIAFGVESNVWARSVVTGRRYRHGRQPFRLRHRRQNRRHDRGSRNAKPQPGRPLVHPP